MSHLLTFGPFELDPARFELRRLGEPVGVQPKVLDLIFYLVQNRARVVTKDELLETVWKGVAVTEASLSQALSLARRALDDTPEAQTTIRTVRSKGLQFVAPVQERAVNAPIAARRNAAVAAAPKPVARPASTMAETVRDDAPRSTKAVEVPYLYAVLHCETPTDGGASWSLADVDEVQIVRASSWRTTRTAGVTRLLTLAIPGRLLSRQHARIVRTPTDWMIVDDDSRNGTFVNGERITKRPLLTGNLIECGRTLLRFANESESGAQDFDSRTMQNAILPTVTPRVAMVARDLERIAPSDVPVLLFGESGVGKTYIGHGVHGLSGRNGMLVSIDCAALGRDDAPGASASLLEKAEGGTLLLENVDRLPGPLVANLASRLETLRDVRLVCTTMATLAELEEQLPRDLLTRLYGFRCELPPLRDRPGDFGVIAGRLLESAGRAQLEIDVIAARVLLRHTWPGNLLELGRTLDVAAALSKGAPIRLEHLPRELWGGSGG